MATDTQPSFSEFLHRKVGRNWVIARRTPSILARYGSDVVTFSKKQFAALEDEYERQTGLSACGMPGEPSKYLKAAAPAMLAILEECELHLSDNVPMSTARMWELAGKIRKVTAKAKGAH